jgi:hypothetical protein
MMDYIELWTYIDELRGKLFIAKEALEVITHYEPSEGGDYFFEHSEWSLPEKYKNQSAQNIAIRILKELE